MTFVIASGATQSSHAWWGESRKTCDSDGLKGPMCGLWIASLRSQ